MVSIYCAIVRSKYDMWLKKWQKRDANQSVPGPAGEGSNGKQSRAARAVRKNGAAVPEAAPTPADADPIIEGVAHSTRTRRVTQLVTRKSLVSGL